MASGGTTSKSITGSDYKFGAKKYAQQLQSKLSKSAHELSSIAHLENKKRWETSFFRWEKIKKTYLG